MGRFWQKWKNCVFRALTVLVLCSSNFLVSKQARLYRVSPTNATSQICCLNVHRKVSSLLAGLTMQVKQVFHEESRF